MKTIRLLLTIPTIEPLTLRERCISSFYPSLIKTSSLAIVVYNGPSVDEQSDYSHPNVIKIGFRDSALISQKFAEIADCPEELLFGKQEYGRSYGGADNLLFALSCALRPTTIGKVDDDCLEFESQQDSWLSNAAIKVQKDAIWFGPYIGQPTGFLYEFDETTSSQLEEFIYGIQKNINRSSYSSSGMVRIKNGNLVLPVQAARIAPYPVLYDPITHIHARGEVYYWASVLRQHGFNFKYDSTLEIRHTGSGRNIPAMWLRSLVLAFDLSLVHRTFLREGRRLSLSERQEEISRFKSWILHAKWPKDIIPEELVLILEENAIPFTENFNSNFTKRNLSWGRLMQNDLGAMIELLLPEVVQKARLSSEKKEH